jgi:phospholipid/cholesterol/gamma-HCH transport system substrate-binding protein
MIGALSLTDPGPTMTRNVFETLLGAIVLVVAIGFLTFAYRSSQISQTDGYELTAKFSRVDGLERGADVRISGIKVGTVVAQSLDPQTFQAQVRFTVPENIHLPVDSSAAVVSNGLLGGKYLALVPGGDIDMLKPGDEVTLTQSAVNVEDLIGHFIFNQTASGPKPGEGQNGAAPAPGAQGADGVGSGDQ